MSLDGRRAQNVVVLNLSQLVRPLPPEPISANTANPAIPILSWPVLMLQQKYRVETWRRYINVFPTRRSRAQSKARLAKWESGSVSSRRGDHNNPLLRVTNSVRSDVRDEESHGVLVDFGRGVAIAIFRAWINQ